MPDNFVSVDALNSTPSINNGAPNSLPEGKVNSDGVEIVVKKSTDKQRFTKLMSKAVEDHKEGKELEPLPAADETKPVDSGTKVDEGETDKAKPKIDQGQNHKNLREALDIANRRIKDFELKAEKTKDYDTVVAEKARLEAEISDIKPKYEELNTWKAKNNLLRSDEFAEKIAVPRQQIRQAATAELKADGVDEALWDQMQGVQTRKELEELVNENVDSQLLKNVLYDLFFKDHALRQEEARALAAPVQYLENLKTEEVAKRNTQTEALRTNFKNIWAEALRDADDMSAKLGENRITELALIPNNDKHNKEIVAPILDTAHKGAEAEINERISLGLSVTRDIASKIVYKWRQAVAARAVHSDRMRWFHEAQRLQKELKDATDKYDDLLAKASPNPGGNRGGDNKQTVQGENMRDRISSFAESFKNDKRE